MYVVLLFSRRLVHRKTSQKSLEKGFGGRTFPLHGVLNAVNMYGISEEVILGDFYYANLVMPSSSISPSSLNALSG